MALHILCKGSIDNGKTELQDHDMIYSPNMVLIFFFPDKKHFIKNQSEDYMKTKSSVDKKSNTNTGHTKND